MSKLPIIVCLACVFVSFAMADGGDLTLRDANIASSVVARYFPMDVVALEYSGAIVQPFRAHLDATGQGCWTIRCIAPDRHSYQIWFEFACEALSQEDVALHVALDRVIYVHVRSGWRDDLGSLTTDVLAEHGISVADLFRQCDQEAVKQLQFYERVGEALREVLEPRRYPATYSPIEAEGARE